LEDLGTRYPTENSKEKKRYGLYQCQYCGKEFKAQINDINRRKRSTKSCGCYHIKRAIETNIKHECAKHPIYSIWKNMKDRCLNPNNRRYKDYGGRGVKVCDRWLNVEYFIDDMYPSYQEGLTLDRINVNGDYEPDNCRWTTKTVQARNTRDIKITNISGFRGVSWDKKRSKWRTRITVNHIEINLGVFSTTLEAAKAYERYVRLNNLEHNFTPALSEDEIKELYKERMENVKI
jgi:hypothetical protein